MWINNVVVDEVKNLGLLKDRNEDHGVVKRVTLTFDVTTLAQFNECDDPMKLIKENMAAQTVKLHDHIVKAVYQNPSLAQS